jgi:flagellar basal body-associated protein FliL
MKTILTLVAPVIITIVVLVGAWQLKLLPVDKGLAASSVLSTPDDQATVNYTLPERIVNLADTPGYRYLKYQVTLEFADRSHRKGDLKGDAVKQREDEFAKEIEPYSPSLEDFLITTLTRKTAAELLSPEGKETLRQQLLAGLRERVPDPPLRAVYFTQFVIQ